MNNNTKTSVDTENLNTTNPHIVEELRASIMLLLPELGSGEKSQHCWLLGTTGCHLCDIAEGLMKQLSAVQPISYHYIDIADFDEKLMMQFATTIPVVLTATQRLNYPFSVLDLQQLLS